MFLSLGHFEWHAFLRHAVKLICVVSYSYGSSVLDQLKVHTLGPCLSFQAAKLLFGCMLGIFRHTNGAAPASDMVIAMQKWMMLAQFSL